MSANAPTTFIELTTDAIQRVRENTTNATVLDVMKRYINQGNHDIHLQQNWWWAERRARLQTHAAYTTGTVSIALAARMTVTGLGTLWNTAVTGYGWNNARVGGKIVFGGETDVYTVSAVGSDTSLTLAEKWIGDTALSAQTYVYFEDEYALASDFWRLIDLRQFTNAFPLAIISRQEFYRRFPRNSSTSQPHGCTIIDLAPSATGQRVPRVLLTPPPALVYNIPYRYITTNLAVSAMGVEAANLSADTDEPIIPLRYRHMLVYYAIAEWYRDRKDDARATSARSAFEDLLKRTANDSMPERDHPRLAFRTTGYRAGVAGGVRRGTSSGLSTGNRFDEMRDS